MPMSVRATLTFNSVGWWCHTAVRVISVGAVCSVDACDEDGDDADVDLSTALEQRVDTATSQRRCCTSGPETQTAALGVLRSTLEVLTRATLMMLTLV